MRSEPPSAEYVGAAVRFLVPVDGDDDGDNDSDNDIGDVDDAGMRTARRSTSSAWLSVDAGGTD